MKHRATVAVLAAFTFVALAVLPAFGAIDYKTVTRLDDLTAANNGFGDVLVTNDVDMARDNNGTSNNPNDDKIDFGSTGGSGGITHVVSVYSGWVVCDPDTYPPYTDHLCWVTPNIRSDVVWVELRIKKLIDPAHPAQGYETHWVHTYNTPSDDTYLPPTTNIDVDKQPFMRIEIAYNSSMTTKNSVTKAAWNSAWEN